uniref:Uncharacterized protein n=1 Tax=Rhizophora mucronata TaxID=61149 RepID=A0A2P2N906_RHIMU
MRNPGLETQTILFGYPEIHSLVLYALSEQNSDTEPNQSNKVFISVMHFTLKKCARLTQSPPQSRSTN